jgi:Zn-dependent protease
MSFLTFIDGAFYVIVLIMSVIIHEFAHGYAAYRYGDNTARMAGRLTLNPIKHLDLFGSVLLPLVLVLSQAGFVIGWAKPVPYNPDNLSNKKWGGLAVASAGIIANLSIAFIFGLFIRFGYLLGLPAFNPLDIEPFYNISIIIVLVNTVLAFFNLIPIPPLDGSKILFAFLPYKYRFVEDFMNRWGIFLLIFFIFFLWEKVSPAVYLLFHLFTGI